MKQHWKPSIQTKKNNNLSLTYKWWKAAGRDAVWRRSVLSWVCTWACTQRFVCLWSSAQHKVPLKSQLSPLAFITTVRRGVNELLATGSVLWRYENNNKWCALALFEYMYGLKAHEVRDTTAFDKCRFAFVFSAFKHRRKKEVLLNARPVSIQFANVMAIHATSNRSQKWVFIRFTGW